MNRLPKFLIVTLIVVAILLAFVIGIYVLPYEMHKQQARHNLQNIITMGLPHLNDFETIRIVSSDFSHSDNSLTCFYARDYVILGTSFSESEALNTYVMSLQELGWEPGWTDPLPNSLIFDEHTILDVSAGQPPPIIRHAINYDELSRNYQTFVFVKVDYILPNLRSCY